jgi:hypothetical protein
MRLGSWGVGVAVCVSIAAGGMSAADNAVASPVLGFESSSVLASNADASLDGLAGSHPYALTSSFKLNTTTNSEGRLVSEGGDLADVVAELPAGLSLDPLAVSQCGAGEFATVNSTTGEDGCPNASAVGVVQIENVTPSTLSERKVASFPIYDLSPLAGTPALFGLDVAGTAVYLTPSIRTGGDYGLTVAMSGIPQGAHVLGGSVTFWGVPGETAHDSERGDCVESHASCPAGIASKALITLPTQCSTAPLASLRADSWQARGQFSASASEALVGGVALGACGALDFSPELQTRVESSAADTPTGLTIDLQIPQSEDPSVPGESQLQEAVVTLPAGMTLNLARAGTLVGCALEGPEGIDLGSSEPGHCPASAKIGGVKVKTPLLSEELQGAIYVAQQGNLPGTGSNPFGSLLALYVLAEGSGVVLKLPVEVVVNRQTGQLTLRIGPDPITGQAFAPQLSFAELELEFSGGSQATIVTPSNCGSYTTTSSLTPWSGAALATLAEESSIIQGCTKAFNPSFAADTTNKQANAFSSLPVTFSRQDGEQEFKSMSATLPQGVVGLIPGVELCPEPQASLGTCGPASLIGYGSAVVGVGPEPSTLTGGRLYFTGPYGGGPFGLSLVMPVLDGQFNLGPEGRPLVIRFSIHVNPRTAQITISSDESGPYSIPSLLEGIEPELRSVTVVDDRPEFIMNASNCGPLPFNGVATSTQGTVANVSSTYQTTGCTKIPFGPKLTASTSGSPSRKNGIGFNVKIVQGYMFEANAHMVRVELPKQLPSRLTTLQKACPGPIFQVNPAGCPPDSIVGSASAVTSALPVPVAGPVYLVSHGSAKFPEVAMVLQGDGVTIDLFGETYISAAGITSSTFDEVPEAPVPSFELHLPAGPNSALTAKGDICAETLRMPTTIVAYNGATVKESPQITVGGCRPAIRVVRHSFHGHTITVLVSVPSAGRLQASGRGVSRRAKTVGKGGTVTLKLTLSKSERRLLAHHHGRRLKIAVKLAFAPSHGAKLSARLSVALR